MTVVFAGYALTHPLAVLCGAIAGTTAALCWQIIQFVAWMKGNKMREQRRIAEGRTMHD